MADLNDFENRLKNSLNPTEPVTNTDTANFTASPVKESVSDKKKRELKKQSDAIRARLLGELNTSELNPIAGISRDATSLVSPSKAVSEGLNMASNAPEFSPTTQALQEAQKSLYEASRSATEAAIENAYGNGDPIARKRMFDQAEWVNSSELLQTESDGDSILFRGGKDRLKFVDTFESAKDDKFKYQDAAGYIGWRNKVLNQASVYSAYSGRDDFTTDHVLQFGENAKKRKIDWLKANPLVKRIVFPSTDQSGRGATLVDYVNEKGESLSDYMRSSPEINANFTNDPYAQKLHENRKKAEFLQAVQKEGISVTDFSGDTNNRSYTGSVLKSAATIAGGFGETLFGGVAGLKNKISEFNTKDNANDTAVEGLSDVDKAQEILNQKIRLQDIARTQSEAGLKNLIDDPVRMSALQKRFRNNPNGDFTDEELGALSYTGINKDYSAIDKAFPENSRKDLLNTKFSLKNINHPEVKKAIGKDLYEKITKVTSNEDTVFSVIDKVTPHKALKAVVPEIVDSVTTAIAEVVTGKDQSFSFDKLNKNIAKTFTGTISPVELKLQLNSDRKDAEIYRKAIKDFASSQNFFTAAVNKRFDQVYDTVKEVNHLKDATKSFKDGNYISGIGKLVGTTSETVLDGLSGLVNHKLATSDTVGASLGAMSIALAGLGPAALVTFGKYADEYTSATMTQKGGAELTAGEHAIGLGLAGLSAAMEVGMAHYLLKGIGKRSDPVQILKGDKAFLESGLINDKLAEAIIRNAEKAKGSSTILAALNTTAEKAMPAFKYMSGLVQKGSSKVKGKLLVNPLVDRMLNPKTIVGKAFNKGVGTTYNLAQNALVLGLTLGPNAVKWVLKKGKDVPRWGRTATVGNMALSYGLATHGEALEEGLMALMQTLAKHGGDFSKVDYESIVTSAREGAAAGSVISTPTLINNLKGINKKAEQERINKEILDVAYNIINSTPEKIRDRVTNINADDFNIDKSYDLFVSDKYTSILNSPSITEKDVARDAGVLQIQYIKEKTNISRKLKNLDEDSKEAVKIKERIAEIDTKLSKIQNIVSDARTYLTDKLTGQSETEKSVISVDTIRSSDYDFITGARSIANKPPESLTQQDIQSATNLVQNLQLKRKTALSEIQSTPDQSPEVIKQRELAINAEYDSLQTKLNDQIRLGTQEILKANNIKDSRVITSDLISNIDSSTDTVEIKKVDANIQENLIPRTTALFGSTQTEINEHRNLLESIINSESLSPESKTQASEMLNLLDKFEQSEIDLKELEKDTEVHQNALQVGDDKKTMYSVFKEVLSATTNDRGKLGLKGYLQTAFTNIASGKLTEAKTGQVELTKWRNGHADKIEKLSSAITKLESNNRGEITVKLSDSGATMKVNLASLPQAKKLLKYMKHELQLMDAANKALKQQLDLTKQIAKRDGEQLNELTTLTTIQANAALNAKEKAKKVKEKVDSDFNSVDESTKEYLIKSQTTVQTILKKDIKNSESLLSNASIIQDKEEYKKLEEEIKSLKTKLELVSTRIKPNELTKEQASVLAEYNSIDASFKVNPNSIKTGTIQQLQRQVKLLTNKAEKDLSIYKLSERKKSVTRKIERLIKKGTTVKSSDVRLNDILKSVQAGVDVPVKDLDSLYNHLKERDIKSPIARATRAVLRQHFKNYTSLAAFLRGTNISPKDKRVVASLVSESSIDTLESLSKKIDELKLEDKDYVRNVISEKLVNEAQLRISENSVDLAKEKLKEKPKATIDSFDRLDTNSTANDIFMRAVIDILGKDHLAVQLLLKAYNSEDQTVFNKLSSVVLGSLENSKVLTASTKRLRGVFDSQGVTENVTDKQLLEILKQFELLLDSQSPKTVIESRQAVQSKEYTDITKTIFKSTNNFTSTIDYLHNRGIITPQKARVAKNKFKTWFSKQNTIRATENAYHENPEITSIEDMISIVGLSKPIAESIDTVVTNRAIKITESRFTYTTKRELTKTEKEQASDNGNVKFRSEYNPELSPIVSELSNNTSYENLVKIYDKFESIDILSDNVEKLPKEAIRAREGRQSKLLRNYNRVMSQYVKNFNPETDYAIAVKTIKAILKDGNTLKSIEPIARLYEAREDAVLRGDVTEVAKKDAQIYLAKQLDVIGFMEVNNIYGYGVSKDQLKLIKLEDARLRKAGKPPIKRSVGFKTKNIGTIEAVQRILVGEEVSPKGNPEVEKAIKVYNRSVENLTEYFINQASLSVEANFRAKIQSKDKLSLRRQRDYTLTRRQNQSKELTSKEILRLSKGDSLSKSDRDKLKNLKSKKDAEKDRVILDKGNAAQYDTILSTIIARSRSNKTINEALLKFYEVLYLNGAISSKFYYNRITKLGLVDSSIKSSTAIGVAINDHKAATGRLHSAYRKVHETQKGAARLKGKGTSNKRYKTRKFSKNTKEIVEENWVNARDYITKIAAEDNISDIPTKSEVLRQSQSYDLIASPRRFYAKDKTPAKQVFDIIKNQVVNLEDFIWEQGESNKEGKANSTVPSMDMFTTKVELSEAPLAARLYGLLNGLSNSSRSSLINRDIQNKDHLKPLKENPKIISGLVSVYKALNSHSTDVYGDMSNTEVLTLPSHLTEASEDILRAFISKETGKMHNQVVEAAAIAFYGYLATEAKGIMNNNTDSVRSLLNLKDDVAIPDATVKFMKHKGTMAANVAQRLGQQMASILNVKIKNPERYANGQLEEMLHVALGMYALTMAQSAKYINIHSIKNKELDKYKRGSQNQLIGELSKNPNASTMFISIDGPIDKVTNVMEEPIAMSSIIADYKESKGDVFMSAFTRHEYKSQFRTSKRTFKKRNAKKGIGLQVKGSVKGNIASKAAQRTAEIASNTAFTVNPRVRLGFEMFGSTVTDIINGVEKKEQFIEALHEGIEGKIRSNQQSLVYMSEILNAVDEGNEIYFDNEVLRNTRVAQGAGGNRPDKNVRILMQHIKGGDVVVDILDSKQFEVLQASMAVAFDIEYSNTWKQEMDEKFTVSNGKFIVAEPLEVLFNKMWEAEEAGKSLTLTEPLVELRPAYSNRTDANGNALAKELYDLTANERDLYNNGTEQAKKDAGWVEYIVSKVGEMHPDDAKILQDALDITDGKHMGFAAIAEIYSIWKNANAKGIKKRTSKNTVYVPREIDGKTHGPVAVSWNMASGALGSNGREVLTEVKDVIARGGVITDRQVAGLFETFEQDDKDNYNQLGLEAKNALSSILASGELTSEQIEATRNMIQLLSGASKIPTKANTIADPNAEKSEVNLERDFFKFILIATIYGSSITGIIDTKVDALADLVLRRYSEIRNSHPDVMKAELRAFNDIVKTIYGDIDLPKTKDEITKFRFTPEAMYTSFNNMNATIGSAVKIATEKKLGSAIKGMQVYNKQAAVQGVITKAMEAKLIDKAIAKKARKLKLDPKDVTLTKKEHEAIYLKLMDMGMMASFATPTTEGKRDRMVFLEVVNGESSTSAISKDRSGKGFTSLDSNGNIQTTTSRKLPLTIRELSSETSSLPAMVQAMVIDSHIMSHMFNLHQQGKLESIEHVFDAAIIPMFNFIKSKVSPGQEMNKAMWETLKWQYHEEMQKTTDKMLNIAKKEGLDIKESINELITNDKLSSDQRAYKEAILQEHKNTIKLEKLKVRYEYLKADDNSVEAQKVLNEKLRDIAKRDALFTASIENSTSEFAVWDMENHMHTADITLSKNRIQQEVKTLDNFPDNDSAIQIKDKDRPKIKSIADEMKKLKNNPIAKWNLANPNATPIKTIEELTKIIAKTNKVTVIDIREAQNKLNRLADAKANEKASNMIEKLYKLELKKHKEELGKISDEARTEALEELANPDRRKFGNKVSKTAFSFYTKTHVYSREKAVKEAFKKRDYRTMPENTPTEIKAKEKAKHRHEDLVLTLQRRGQRKLDLEVIEHGFRLSQGLRKQVFSATEPELLDTEEQSTESVLEAIREAYADNSRINARNELVKLKRAFEDAVEAFNKNSNEKTLEKLEKASHRLTKATYRSQNDAIVFGAKQTTHKINGDNILDVFKNISYLGGKRENPKHLKYLEDYVANTLAPLLGSLDEDVNLEIYQGGDTNGGSYTGAKVKLNFTYSQSRYSSHDMSQQEVYAHEFSHIFWSVMAHKNSAVYNELRTLQETAADVIAEVMKDKGLPPEAVFYPRNDKGEIEFFHSESNEKLAAKEKFDYIFKSENGMYEFAVFAETNEAVMNAFKEHKLKHPAKLSIIEAIKALWNKILSMISKDRRLGTIKNGQTVHNRLKEIKAYAQAQHNKNLMVQVRGVSIENRINSKLAKFIADNVTKNYVKFVESKYNPRTNIIKAGNKLAPIYRATRASLVTPLFALTDRFEEPLKKLHDSLLDNRRNFLYQFIKEVKHNSKKRQEHANLLYKGKAVNETIKSNIVNATFENVVKGFKDGTNFTYKDWDNLNEVIVRGELHHLYEKYGMDGMMKIVTNDTVLASAINRMKRDVGLLAGKSANVILAQAESLANFTANGEPTIRNHAMNTYVIANQMMIPDGLKAKISKENVKALEKDLNVLVSLQHLAAMPSTALNNARKIMKEEYDSNRSGNNGIHNMLAIMKANYNQSLNSSFNGDPTLMERGHSRDEVNKHRKHLVANLDKADELRKKYGMELYREIGGNKGIFYSKFNTEQDWQNGSFAFSTEGSSKGLDIRDHYQDMYKGDNRESVIRAAQADIAKLDKSRESELLALIQGKTPTKPVVKMVPIMSPSRDIVSYRAIISHKDKREILGMTTHAAKSIAYGVVDAVSKFKSKETNKAIIKLIHQQWVNRDKYPNQKFVELDKNSDDPEIAEISQMIPHQDWKEFERVFGKGNPIMMTDSLIPMVFGYRKGGLIETLNRQFDNGMNANIRKFLHQSARLYQAGVAEWKRRTVLLTPSVFINNLKSNTLVLKLRGMFVEDSIAGQADALVYMNRYIEDTKEVIELELKEHAGVATKDDIMRIRALKRHLINNPVNELVKSGAFSPNVEDISTKHNRIKQVLTDLAPDGIKDTISEIAESFPKPVRTLASNFYITRETKASDMLTYATQVSDFAARFALYNHLTKNEGMPKEKAIEKVIEQFVSYDENTSMPIQWMNDNGIWNFSKYALRSAKTVTDLYTEKPANMLILHMLEGLTDIDLVSPVDSFIGFNGINMNGVSASELIGSAINPPALNYLPDSIF